jgi:hypothetical protein
MATKVVRRTGGLDRLALAPPGARSAGGLGSFRRLPWRLILAHRSALPRSSNPQFLS